MEAPPDGRQHQFLRRQWYDTVVPEHDRCIDFAAAGGGRRAADATQPAGDAHYNKTQVVDGRRRVQEALSTVPPPGEAECRAAGQGRQPYGGEVRTHALH